MILRVVRRNDKRKHEPNKGTPAGKVGAVLAIGGSKFSQIQKKSMRKLGALLAVGTGICGGAGWPSRGV